MALHKKSISRNKKSVEASLNFLDNSIRAACINQAVAANKFCLLCGAHFFGVLCSSKHFSF